MALTVIWLPQVRDAIRSILHYGLEHFGQKVVTEFHREVVTHTESLLVTNPCLGKREPLLTHRIDAEYRSLVVHSHFKLVYTIDQVTESIYIVDIWDTRINPINLAHRMK